GLAPVRIFEIPILAFINFLPDATVRSRGGECAGARSELMPELTFDLTVARVRRVAVRLRGVDRIHPNGSQGIA
ncbi:hypothetical protein PIB30_065460, partial [Stylosanthes scabra]|nr:hypothetical protein [Stylosanthes scabra]